MSKTYIIEAQSLHLKTRNVTCKELAHDIGLSEISVKRLFTGGSCGLDRLEQICQYPHLDFSDLFKTTLRYPNTVQLADINDALPEGFGGDAAPAVVPSANTFSNFVEIQGNTLNSKQQAALATQIDKLGLGGEGDLSFYSLPNGRALIANADGDIVGEINRNSATGDLQLKANGIDADGNPVEVNNHIGEQGQVLSDAAVVQGQASYMFNSLMAVNNWDHLTDVGKLSALVNLYNATDKLGEAFGATGDNLPGDLGAAAGYLQMAQGLQSGDNLVIANGINVVSDGALDGAMNQAFGNTAAGEAVPYLSYALTVRNFADNPAQAANEESFRSVA